MAGSSVFNTQWLELYQNFITKVYDTNNFEELELVTKLLQFARENCIRPEMQAGGNQLSSKDCNHSFTADINGHFFRQTCCVKHKIIDKLGTGLFKEEFKSPET